MRTKVKICGVTNLEDAAAALRFDADYIGLNFWPKSRRRVSDDAVTWTTVLPSTSKLIGVFVDEPMANVLRIADAYNLAGIQLHGRESPRMVEALRKELGQDSGKLIFKAIRMVDASSVEGMAEFVEFVDGFLLDAAVKGKPGGTGRVFDWSLVSNARRYGRPLLLAGGLTPENVAEAVQSVKPDGVDVASGVERSPGVKDHEKVRRFIQNARKADETAS